MTTKNTHKNVITTALLIIAKLLLQSCNKPTEPAKEIISITRIRSFKVQTNLNNVSYPTIDVVNDLVTFIGNGYTIETILTKKSIRKELK